MPHIPSVLTNKFVLTGLANSALKNSSAFTPIASGAISRMGKVLTVSPSKVNPVLKGTFSADLTAIIPTSKSPAGLSNPSNVLKKWVR
eukprot:CAMPEP_0113521134 /NCGR_PEP_ID=MMETSP0014_2-20120614/44475_1 /TAXON_ID=2857 /ORGANISM="Nitzschia sp." /LENGTH=87 /DNA_ID=CAMNT_0000419067 /DNA_START=26 /DNA_END=289 /DNA_ORIENTATION=- /assembly_acc=CAM_ASM_000159